MLELAREQWLWMFVLLALFFAAWFIARRYRKQRVTFGAVWERVARRVLPPTWKRLLRQAVTLLIALCMLSAVVLYAAGLQRPEADLPAPLILIIVQDNSVSMRARHGDSTRRELANQRAQQILAALAEHDRAVLASFHFGQPQLGPWLSHGADAALPPTDFAKADLPALAAAIRELHPPPDLPETPNPIKALIWLGGSAPELSAEYWAGLQPMQPNSTSFASLRQQRIGDNRLPLWIETFGGPADNDAIIRARYMPPRAGEAHGGTVEAATLSGREPEVIVNGWAQVGSRVTLPPVAEGAEVKIRAADGDALPEDDAVSFDVRASTIQRIAVCYPAADGEPNPLLVQLIRSRLPGRELNTVAVTHGQRVEADLLVADRALPQDYSARALLLFGVAGTLGETGPPVRALPNLRAPTAVVDVGMDVPDLALIAAEQAVPLRESLLTPLTRHIEGGTLIAIQRQPQEVLYSGFIPHLSTLIESPDGLLLLVRWLELVQQAPPPLIAPLVAAGEAVRLVLSGPAEIRPDGDAGWPESLLHTGYAVNPGPDGTAEWQVPDQPGRWLISKEDGTRQTFQIVWSNSSEQALPFVPFSSFDAASLARPSLARDWRNLLPGLLLWIALGLLLLEWALWATGILE